MSMSVARRYAVIMSNPSTPYPSHRQRFESLDEAKALFDKIRSLAPKHWMMATDVLTLSDGDEVLDSCTLGDLSIRSADGTLYSLLDIWMSCEVAYYGNWGASGDEKDLFIVRWSDDVDPGDLYCRASDPSEIACMMARAYSQSSLGHMPRLVRMGARPHWLNGEYV